MTRPSVAEARATHEPKPIAQQPDSFPDRSPARVVLEDGSVFRGYFFGHHASVAGEVVFNTGMVGYPETLTDPSYCGQILVLTYPLIGNYGVPPEEGGAVGLRASFESDKIQVAGLVVADYSPEYSHWHADRSLSDWLAGESVPAVTGVDTRSLTQLLRERGSMLGKVLKDDEDVDWYDPNAENLVARVSIKRPQLLSPDPDAPEIGKRVVLIDTGAKHNIAQCLLSRGLEVLRAPFDYTLADEKQLDGLVISNGPGDPEMVEKTLSQIRWAIDKTVPIFGVCLGNQLLARAVGAKTYKLKYGHRGQNQPVIECGTNRCLVTSQNHGFAVDSESLPSDWRPWFENLNDRTNEGVRHSWGPFRSVQFHPEARPGPVDAEYLFDEFVQMLGR